TDPHGRQQRQPARRPRDHRSKLPMATGREDRGVTTDQDTTARREAEAAFETQLDEMAEAVARLIDPSTWRVLDSYLGDVKRKYKGKDAGYDPAAFKDKKSIALAYRI